MAKPYILWDPAYNADLLTRASEGPLVVTMPAAPTPAQLEVFDKLFTTSSIPVAYDDPRIFYLNVLSKDVLIAPKTGLHVDQYAWMPEDLTYPAPGPDPYDLSNLFGGVQYRFANLGWRILLRGYSGTMFEGTLAGEFRVKWADAVTRSALDPRGVWTGMVLDFFNIADQRTDHVVNTLHGKRLGDPDWLYHGGWLDRVPSPGPEVVNENAVVLNSVTSGELRLVITATPPTWSAALQYYNGTWITIDTYEADFRSHMPPAALEEIGVIASLFAGMGVDKPGSPPPEWPVNETWFSEVQVPQFEPWVADIADWTAREWDEYWLWITFTPKQYGLGLSMPRTDLMHVPVGSARAPEELRHSDPEMGICVKLGAKSSLFAYGNADNRLIETSDLQPLTVCDQDAFGEDAPFAFYMRVRFDAMPAWGSDRNIVQFGNIQAGPPSAGDNGIGIFWRSTGATSGEFVARAYLAVTGWEEAVFVVPDVSVWTDRPLNIGFVWSGARGSVIGREDYELRLVINGITRASNSVGPFDVSTTSTAQLGATDTLDGYQGLLRYAAVIGGPVTDEGLERAFSAVQQGFSNPSFETPAASGRPGEAEDWNWRSVQVVPEWAEFNAYDVVLLQWRTALEIFGPGWYDLQNWADDLSDLPTAVALFNAGITAYETLIELFAFWGKVWPDFTWQGPPWREAFTLVRPDQDNLGLNNGPTGFDSWYDHLFGTNVLPMEEEDFGQGWDTDPLSTAPGHQWHPGTATDARLTGDALEAPITIPPDKNRLVVFTDMHGIVELEVTAQEYTSIGSLAGELNTQWLSKVGSGTGIEFEEVLLDGDWRLTFGWDGLTIGAYSSMFGIRADEPSNDLRPLIGMDALGYGGRQSPIPVLEWMVSGTDDDLFEFDAWTFLDFVIMSDPFLGYHPVVYGQTSAVFDTAIPAPVQVERFVFGGWFPGATWKTDLESPVAAMFDSGTVDLEEFNEAEWPDEIWT